MKNVYLAARFTSALKEQTFDNDYKEKLLKIIDHLRQAGFKVNSAHLKEDFGNIKIQAADLVNRDLDDIMHCDYFIALLDENFSGGVHIEIGWASILKKPVLILLPMSMSEKEVSPVIFGLNNLTLCTINKYRDLAQILQLIDTFIGFNSL